MAGKYKNKSYNLRLNEEIMSKIRQLAEENYRPISKQIEIMLVKYINDLKSDDEMK